MSTSLSWREKSSRTWRSAATSVAAAAVGSQMWVKLSVVGVGRRAPCTGRRGRWPVSIAGCATPPPRPTALHPSQPRTHAMRLRKFYPPVSACDIFGHSTFSDSFIPWLVCSRLRMRQRHNFGDKSHFRMLYQQWHDINKHCLRWFTNQYNSIVLSIFISSFNTCRSKNGLDNSKRLLALYKITWNVKLRTKRCWYMGWFCGVDNDGFIAVRMRHRRGRWRTANQLYDESVQYTV